MAKKKKHKKHFKQFRNASPRPARPAGKEQEDTPLKRLGYTAAGAAGTSLAGSFLAHEGWAPKTIATALAAVGAGLAWKGDAATIRSIGAGVMSAAGSQLALLMIDDRDKKAKPAAPPVQADAKKQSNAGELPPGALETAFERAKARLAISDGDPIEMD